MVIIKDSPKYLEVHFWNKFEAINSQTLFDIVFFAILFSILSPKISFFIDNIPIGILLKIMLVVYFSMIFIFSIDILYSQFKSPKIIILDAEHGILKYSVGHYKMYVENFRGLSQITSCVFAVFGNTSWEKLMERPRKIRKTDIYFLFSDNTGKGVTNIRNVPFSDIVMLRRMFDDFFKENNLDLQTTSYVT